MDVGRDENAYSLCYCVLTKADTLFDQMGKNFGMGNIYLLGKHYLLK